MIALCSAWSPQVQTNEARDSTRLAAAREIIDADDVKPVHTRIERSRQKGATARRRNQQAGLLGGCGLVGAAGGLWTAAQGPHDGTARYPRNPQDRGDQSRRVEDKRRAVMKGRFDLMVSRA